MTGKFGETSHFLLLRGFQMGERQLSRPFLSTNENMGKEFARAGENIRLL